MTAGDPAKRLRGSGLLTGYRALAGSVGPLATHAALAWRVRRGKEDPARLGERWGRASAPRPDGPLVWLHGASVGEAVSLLPLIQALRAARPGTTALLTTTTRSSAGLIADLRPEGVIHQYAPADLPGALRAFFDHWRPDFLGVAESEIWPTMLGEARRRGTPTALLSARLSARSAKRWGAAPRSIAALLDRFDVIAPQTDAVADRLLALGAAPDRLRRVGSLKAAAPPLRADEAERDRLAAALGERPRWIAASTHEGEETIVAEAHQRLAAARPGLLTILAPRHPERADAIDAGAAAAGLRVARRSRVGAPPADADLFLVDRIGELGLWFRLAPIAFIGGSIARRGGHNPLEPARLDAATLFGPDMANFAEERRLLLDAQAAEALPDPTDAEALATAVGRLLDDPAAAAAMGRAGRAATASGGAAVLDAYLAALAPLLPPQTRPSAPGGGAPGRKRDATRRGAGDAARRIAV